MNGKFEVRAVILRKSGFQNTSAHRAQKVIVQVTTTVFIECSWAYLGPVKHLR